MGLSIVVPTLNEAGNVTLLTERVHKSLHTLQIPYEIIFVDDHSSDATVKKIEALTHRFPVSVQLKQGQRGKAFSIIQGVEAAQYDIVCMIDADLQYPPESIPMMLQMMNQKNADVVLSRRIDSETSKLRRFVSKAYNLIFTQLLFGINYDTQSGLKLFKKSVFDGIQLDPSPWSFDLEFIIRCLQRGKKILSYDIPFSERFAGKAKISVVQASLEILKASLRLRLKVSKRQIKKAYQFNVRYAAEPLS